MIPTEAQPAVDKEPSREVELVGGPFCGESVHYYGKGDAYVLNWRGRSYTYLLEPSGKTAFIKNP